MNVKVNITAEELSKKIKVVDAPNFSKYEKSFHPFMNKRKRKEVKEISKQD
jgi:hypothetical protein